MKFLTALAVAPALVAAVPTPIEFTVPPPAGITVRNITYGGTGCPQGSASIQIDTTGTLFTLIFDSYQASIGPSIPVTENRKVCTLNADILYPSGYQYSIFAVDTQGYVNIEGGVTATVRSGYYFSGESTKQRVFEINKKGPYEADYVKVDEIPVTSEIWSPCGIEGMMNVATQIRLSSTDKKASGMITTDSLSGKFRVIAAVQWQKCTK